MCSLAEALIVVILTPFTQPVSGHIKCFVFQSLILTTDLQRAQTVRQESNASRRPVAVYTRWAKSRYTVYSIILMILLRYCHLVSLN